MKPLSASEYDRRREFQIAAHMRLLSSPTPASRRRWRLLSPRHQGAPAIARTWRAMSWRWMRATE
jgi:hypothetical protein